MEQETIKYLGSEQCDDLCFLIQFSDCCCSSLCKQSHVYWNKPEGSLLIQLFLDEW